MKKRLLLKSCLFVAAAFAAVSCDDDVNLGNTDTGMLEIPNGYVVNVTDASGKRNVTEIDLKNQPVTTQLQAKASAALGSDCTLKFVFDAKVLEEYNRRNGSSYVALPESMVTIANNGNLVLAAGSTSASIDVTVTPNINLNDGTAYAIPVSISLEGDASLGSQDASYVILVNDLTSIPNCFKTWTDDNGDVHPGIKIFSVMEVNDTNPLNNLRYTLKESGKYMVDALVMFSGNINYDADNGKVYFYPNENVKALLDNREKYLKPLQDRGMKVIMGVMCNHDRACIANLGPEAAKLFAKELKALCDAYQLDGIFWDDEYCSPLNPPPPGFDERSSAAWSRLAYEVWNLQPDRWNIAYGYSNTSSAIAINGVEPGTYISYYLPDYGSWYSDVSEEFPGMTLSQMGGCSMEFAQGRWYATETTLRNMRNDGYGAMMVFAMDPYRENADGQDAAMAKLAKAFYNDEVVIDPTKYPKDWK